MKWLLLAWIGTAHAAPKMIPLQEVDLVGRTAPDFTAEMLDGGDFHLEEHRGKTVLLSFWASWCGPCRAELPALAELQQQRDDVVVFAVNVDKDKASARRFLARTPFELPIVWDSKAQALGNYEVLSMPTMFLLDEHGTVTWRKTGYSTSKGLTELVAQLDGGAR